LEDGNSCLTLETNSRCHFPFEHNGFLHYSCVPLTSQGRQQCPVAPDSPPSSWEHCKASCPSTPGCPHGWAPLGDSCGQIFRVANGTTRQRAAEICGQHGAIVPRVDSKPTGRGLRDSLALFYREKEGDTACYRGEALWLDTEGEGAECRAWVADAHMAREVTRGFPVTSLPCNATMVDVWETSLKVQALCMIEAPSPKLDNGLIFKSFFTSVISNIFGVTSSLWGTVRENQGWEKGASCPPGFSALAQACYLFAAEVAESKEEAEALCSKRGSTLADLRDQEILEKAANYWTRQRPACGDQTFWWVARLPPTMAGEGNCTSGPKVDLTSHKRASTALDSSQIRKEKEVGKMVVDCQAETRARPLCMRGKMTRDEVKRQRFETFLQGLSRVVKPSRGQADELGTRLADEKEKNQD